jgi:hypothetical protein
MIGRALRYCGRSLAWSIAWVIAIRGDTWWLHAVGAFLVITGA